MMSVLVALLMVFASGDPQQAEAAPAEPAVPATPNAQAEPKVICTMEPITGTRAKKQRVCRTREYDKQSERWRDSFEDIIRRSGNGQHKPPPLPGGLAG